MFESRLLAALAAGSTVVTPNKRLARTLVATYDNEQRSAGRGAWPAARALPWSAWLEQLWNDVLAHDALPSITRLLRAPQVRWRWRQIIAADDAALSDIRGAVALAAEAWAIAKAWGSGGESWRGWRNDALGDDDCAAYAGWAERFHAALGHMHAVDDASLADAIVRAIDGVDAWRNLDIVLAGFIEPTPQHDRLIAALTERGARFTRCDTIADRPTQLAHTSAGSPRDEMLLALAWARTEALADPGATIGIGVENLGARRAEVIALAEDVLCPALQLPGHEGETRPYNVSLGSSLASAPLVAAALGWIELSIRSLPLAQAVVLFRSPYLPDATTQWPRRASLERTWLEMGRREIGYDDAMRALDGVDRALGERLRRAFATHRLPNEASPKAWVDLWRGWLTAIGWPGDRPLSSAEQQTRSAFDELLVNFAAMSVVDERMRAFDALSALHDLGDDTVFQPESSPVPIQIVGLLEAAGLPFDRLWIAGLAADRWPRAPQPHPLLPLAWQRDHDVPRSSAARELRFARKVTTLLLRGAQRVVVSHARSVDDDEPCRASQLIAELNLPALAPSGAARNASYASQIHASAPALEAIADLRVQPLAEGASVRGGAHAIEAQANCPFQAVALHRFNVDRWPGAKVGLTAMERGTLVHAALAAFWNDVGDSATLETLDDSALTANIATAAESARRALKEERWRWVPPVIAAGEASRIAALLHLWIDAYERTRPPFTVDATEARADVTLAGVSFRLRLDRVDRVPDGAAIIDYKTGPTLAPKAWFDPRPRSPQLGLYALARRQAAPESPTCAVAYAQLQPGALKVNGIAADVVSWPALIQVETAKVVGSWPALEAWWEAHLGALAGELRSGVADVAPRDGPKTCRICGLGSLCRVGGVALDVDEDAGDE
jgi:ATP-dependent helicase/nuclease subunit B